ncbi:B-cell antigen receptor complex-associated protein beta chain [Seriola lalandi dorsalis]|uniref:B-cell antigen receptor complex-associated protein beta chain n=1 Tax=Seriola lalandi dorsalis TaxID=1841481 RepID=UPI000C6F4BC1|nr:B-cell antigen receptor complex-associated protein beta chain [Seriola lalandi dorsalis]
MELVWNNRYFSGCPAKPSNQGRRNSVTEVTKEPMVILAEPQRSCVEIGDASGGTAALQVIQKPRFYGVKPGRILSMYCSSESEKPDTFQWYKADMYDQKPEERVEVTGKRFEYSNKGVHQNAFLYIRNTHREDSGVYFCKMNNATWGPGTEVRVVRRTDITKALHFSRMKDGLIIFQGLLLAVSIAAMLLRKHTQIRD